MINLLCRALIHYLLVAWLSYCLAAGVRIFIDNPASATAGILTAWFFSLYLLVRYAAEAREDMR